MVGAVATVGNTAVGLFFVTSAGLLFGLNGFIRLIGLFFLFEVLQQLVEFPEFLPVSPTQISENKVAHIHG